MRLQGCGSLFASRTKGTVPPPGRSTGSRFLDELKKTADSAAAAGASDTVDCSRNDAGLRELLNRLTPESRDVLDRMEAGRDDVDKEEWTNLCRELEALGAISKDDFQYTRAEFRFVPLGYWGENGAFVKYDTLSIMKNKLPDPHHSQGGQWARLDEDDWKGDPLAYLEDWMTSLYSWRSELARARNGDGTAKYSDFSPITNQINACQKVTDLVRALWSCETQTVLPDARSRG